jgi:hypothetical protein
MSIKQFGALVLMSGLIVTVSTVISVVRDQVFAQPVYSNGPNPTLNVPVEAQPPKWLVGFERLDNQDVQVVTIVDPESKRIGVYKVDLNDRKIYLQSIRSVDMDLRLHVYNATAPFPQYIDQNFRNMNQGN